MLLPVLLVSLTVNKILWFLLVRMVYLLIFFVLTNWLLSILIPSSIKPLICSAPSPRCWESDTSSLTKRKRIRQSPILEASRSGGKRRTNDLHVCCCRILVDEVTCNCTLPL